MYAQIEITTVCNFSCFYCAGRQMPQQHMPINLFRGILESLQQTENCKVSLQGEGEPTLHPDFTSMVEMVRQAGHTPYSIINGSHIDAKSIKELFPEIGVSLDTLDPVEAERIGRYNLQQVLDGIERLISVMGTGRIILHTVNYGQSLELLNRFAASRKLYRRVVQPLQPKDDYRFRYPDLGIRPGKWAYRLRCRYLEQPLMRYFDVNGLELPCRYIKDTSQFISTQHTLTTMRQRQLPGCCAGCREIMVRLR